jgi:hypothetical protein
MVMLSKKSVLLAEAETTYGTDPTPTAADNALLVLDAEIKESHEVIERGERWASLDHLPSVKGESYAEFSFKIAVIGSGTAGTAPRVGALLKAAGLAETVVSSTSVTYQNASASHGSVTLYLYKDGRLHKLTGARCSALKLVYEAGKQLLADFTFQGIYNDSSLVAVPSCTYESTVTLPPMCKSSAFSYNSKTTLVTKSVELDLGISLAKRPSLSEATAVKGFEIVAFRPKVVIDPECQIETSYTFRTDQLTTTRALSVLATRAAGNIVTLNVPQFNITKVEYADRDGVLIEKLEGEAAATVAGNNALNIVFT